MPTYSGDPTRVAAGFPVLPKGDYEFTIGEPKAFEKVDPASGEVKNHGVRYMLTVVNECAQKGAKVSQTLYYHTLGAEQMAKRFILAANGYQVKDEKRFDADFTGKDWGYDPASNSTGDGFRELVGKRIVGNFDVKLGQNDEDQQDIKGWRPI